MSLDFKKSLPESGVAWLFLRAQTRVIREGKMDLDVTVLDETGEVVVLAKCVVLIVPNRSFEGLVGDKESKM